MPFITQDMPMSDAAMTDTLSRLAEVLEARKGAAPDSSYVASLYHKGLNKILEKVGEESVETILAAKDAAVSGDCSDLIYETADLWFHSLVMLAALGQHPQAYWTNWTAASACPDTTKKPRAPTPTNNYEVLLSWVFSTGNTG